MDNNGSSIAGMPAARMSKGERGHEQRGRGHEQKGSEAMSKGGEAMSKGGRPNSERRLVAGTRPATTLDQGGE